MAFDYVTSKQGKPHVTAAQTGALQAATIGDGRYVLSGYAGDLSVTMTDANTLEVSPCALVVDGRYLVNDEAVAVAIANGGQESYRHDLVVLTVTDDASTGIGSVSLDVVQGEPASSAAEAADPAIEEGSMLDGGTARVAIARVSLANLTPTAEPLLPSVSSMSDTAKAISKRLDTLGESISRIIPWGESTDLGKTVRVGIGFWGSTSEPALKVGVRTDSDNEIYVAFDKRGASFVVEKDGASKFKKGVAWSW